MADDEGFLELPIVVVAAVVEGGGGAFEEFAVFFRAKNVFSIEIYLDI